MQTFIVPFLKESNNVVVSEVKETSEMANANSMSSGINQLDKSETQKCNNEVVETNVMTRDISDCNNKINASAMVTIAIDANYLISNLCTSLMREDQLWFLHS